MTRLDDQLTRRRIVSALAAASTVGLAGCGTLRSGGGDGGHHDDGEGGGHEDERVAPTGSPS
jgi:hypothetical protein